MIEVIRDLYAYTGWANERVLDAAEPLSAEQLDRDLGSSFPSIRATLAHMLGAEWIWLRRWKGESPSGPPAEWRLDTVAGLRAQWAGVHAERTALLAGLDDAALEASLDYRSMGGDPFRAPLRELLLHAVNHSTYHRGQVITMLRQVGAAGISTDLVVYHRALARV